MSNEVTHRDVHKRHKIVHRRGLKAEKVIHPRIRMATATKAVTAFGESVKKAVGAVEGIEMAIERKEGEK